MVKKVTRSVGICVLLSMLAFQQQQSRKIIFFGDSITKGGSKPDGFIELLDQHLKASGNTRVELVNAGIGGDKITDLFFRFDKDILSQHPDQVVIYIGINDVWHQNVGTGTDLNKYIRFYEEMIRQLQARKIDILICTPSVIGEKKDFTNKYDGDLNAFSNAVREIARKSGVALLDLRKAFIAYEQTHNSQNQAKSLLTEDGVHLNKAGNALLARLMKEKLHL